jgi:hypothetical protein
MARPSSHIVDLAKRGAEVRYRQLIAELKMLTVNFPHLRDAVDRDELPLMFLMREGRDRATAKAAGARKQRRTSSVAAPPAAAVKRKGAKT